MDKMNLIPKQFIFLLLPLLIACYIFIYPNDFRSINNEIDNLLSQKLLTKKDINIAKNKHIIKNIEPIKKKIDIYEKSLIEFNQDTSIWSIDMFYSNLNNKQFINKNGDKEYTIIVNNIKKRVKFIRISSSNKTITNVTKKIKVPKPVDEQKPIDLSKFNLQMIFNSSGKVEVVINNEIYKQYDKIDNDIQIIKILSNKVLLKNKREKKWLYIIK